MTHLDPSSLAAYNSLTDPYLQSYFSNERIRSHLKHAGLISDRGEIISDGEYRSKLARREHARHVRHMLAENIVNRAVDMERIKQAEMKRQYEMISKAALVNHVKESRKRNGTLFGSLTSSNDMGLLSIDLSCSQTRPKSANPQNELYNDQTRIPRLQLAQYSDDHPIIHSSNIGDDRRRHRRHQHSFQRIKSLNKSRSSSAQRSQSSNKHSDSMAPVPCQVTMIYYGPHTKVDYDNLVCEQTDEVIVMQQHCGGENLIVYKNYLKSGVEFAFESRRHSDYPFGLSLYVKGLIDSRISTCCEYKHRHGVKLGGDRGHFAIKSVYGSKPCLRCKYEKEARLKRYAQSPKHADDDGKIPITIPLTVFDEPKIKETSVIIPVRHTSSSNVDNNYSEDFDDSDTPKPTFRETYSTDSSRIPLHMNELKSKSNDSTPKDLPSNERQHEWPRKDSRSSLNDEDHEQSIKPKPTKGISSRSRTSSNASKKSNTKFPSARRQSADTQSSQSEKTSPRDNLTDRETKIRYRVIIYPSRDRNGKFKPNHTSRIYLRLNNQLKETRIKNEIDQACPEFEPGVQKEFDVDLIQNANEQPETLTLGYYNSDPTAETWKLEKIVLVNVKTRDKIIFPCNGILSRDESNLCAQKQFTVQLQDFSDEGTPRKWKINREKSDNEQERKELEKQQSNDDDDDDDDDDDQNNNKRKKNEERSPSFQSMSDNDATYKKIFQKLDPNNELELGSTSSSRTPRSIQPDGTEKKYKEDRVDSLASLDNLTDPTPRSNDQLSHHSLSQRTVDKTQNKFKNSHRTANDSDEDN